MVSSTFLRIKNRCHGWLTSQGLRWTQASLSRQLVILLTFCKTTTPRGLPWCFFTTHQRFFRPSTRYDLLSSFYFFFGIRHTHKFLHVLLMNFPVKNAIYHHYVYVSESKLPHNKCGDTVIFLFLSCDNFTLMILVWRWTNYGEDSSAHCSIAFVFVGCEVLPRSEDIPEGEIRLPQKQRQCWAYEDILRYR